jgi:hypothetical protein
MDIVDDRPCSDASGFEDNCNPVFKIKINYLYTSTCFVRMIPGRSTSELSESRGRKLQSRGRPRCLSQTQSINLRARFREKGVIIIPSADRHPCEINWMSCSRWCLVQKNAV